MSKKNPKLTAEQKFDIELAAFFVRVDLRDLDDSCAEVETAKVCNCTVDRVREAVARIKNDFGHPYWIGKK